MQTRIGARAQAVSTERVIQRFIPEAAMYFISQQTMAVVSSRDAEGNVWASMLFGSPGFLNAETERQLRLDHILCFTATGDPVWQNLKQDPEIGILLIELSSRRRLRINGRVRQDSNSYLIEVDRFYPNCPKYIQTRNLTVTGNIMNTRETNTASGERLTPEQCKQLSRADTFFVASAHPKAGCDASHRGGHPGFIEVLNAQRLRIPEYAGNGMFNTLGNFESYPYAGLVFPDFENNRILQLTGQVEVLWHEYAKGEKEFSQPYYWEFKLESWQESVIPIELKWEFLEYSPFLPMIPMRQPVAAGGTGKS
ncbi:pyridoxamine 5'-phosphate oxidase family protein [Thiomicrorhabdus sp. HH1]|uniref:Pyridoxamine 5'-phosphate oxidase family protein n=2 Tax=Thiomicrorhabdus heinhorstiae TaxID=2748010 RepID=A0ABS0BUL6_9GAMM|nr:pyridoxamine 5'-phosphate oxidase family protein [Thiomicrorhabdus heinhorstiae]MBF6057499.1 pyridoxamine 5'-phosphate oxidase family protein [Thiomicrorhabdus heinhorstiae]